jgi:TonB-dependent receptor
VLPSVGLVVKASDEVTVRGSFSRTVARQTFKELTPIVQQEYLGAPVFVGNPDLQMSALENYDLRVDYTTEDNGLLSASWFQKYVDDPIEYVQRLADYTFTTPTNYPEGELSGYEFEIRQPLRQLSDGLEGFSLGLNATFIDSEVTLPADEALAFDQPGIEAPMSSRDMTGAPEHLYNFYLTYDRPESGTQIALFYTVQGDTLVAGAGQANGHFVPNVYEKQYGTLNLTLSQKLGRFFTLQLQAKNLTNPEIEEVYRSEFIGGDVTKTSYTKGIEFAVGIGASFSL